MADEPKIYCSYTKLAEISSLKPNPANPNRHPDSQVEVLAKLITSHGWRHSVTVSKRSGYIVSGHCRLLAALKLELRHIPIDEQDFTSEAEEMAVLVADNQIPELSEMDGLKMADILCELDQVNYPLELTALSPAEIEDYIIGPTEPNPQDNIIPEPPKKAKTKTGDLYILGDHRLLCGDSTKVEDVERLMNGQKADMVFTDPPYGVNYDGGRHNEKKRIQLNGDSDTSLYIPCCNHSFLYSKKSAPLYLWHAGIKGIAAAAAAAAAGYEIRCELIWHKLKAHYGAYAAQYMQKHEPCYYCYKRNQTAQWFGPTNEVTVWEIEQPSINEYHPTQKPLALAERAIINSSKIKQIILDIFLGSGTTLIACEKLKRRCFGIEIDPLYTQVCIERWQQFTGKDAILESTGQKFADICSRGRRANG